MNTDNLNLQLQRSGLSENEATIYIALLRSGKSTVTQIAETASVNRASAYPILASLETKGLVEKLTSLTTVTYQANPPTKYRELMRANVDRYRQLKREVEDSVPALRKQYASSNIRPKIFYFATKAGMKHAFEMTLTSKEKIMRVISYAENIFQTFPGYLPQYIFKRAMRGIAMKGIHPRTSLISTLKAMPQTAGDSVTTLPVSKYKFEVDIAIWDMHVSYMSHTKLYSISVESLPFAATMKQVYDLAWNYTNRTDPNSKLNS